MSLSAVLAEHQLSHLEPVLAAAAIDLDVAADLSEADLQSLGIALGDRKRLLRALGSASAPVPQPQGERRMITAAFIDLADFTALSTSLDPEVLRSAVADYQRLATRVIEEWDGAVAQYLGDGVLAYFGYPRAHEDDAERAVRAAVSIVSGTAELSVAGRPLLARAGVATGLVVVGGVVASELVAGSVAVGEAPNRAARLQGHGSPGDVTLDAATRRLLGAGIQLQELGPAQLKGFAQPIACWRVAGVADVGSRFQSRAGSADMVGRAAEWGVLRDCWQAACANDGRGVLVCGEPGMGKSRLVDELLALARATPAGMLLLQCSPHHTATDHYALRNAIDVQAGHSAAQQSLQERLARWIKDFAGEDEASALTWAQQIAPLVAGDPNDPVPIHEIHARLVALLCDAAARRPVLVLLEDLHWIDPSTAEWLRAAATACRGRRMLLVATARPQADSALRWKPDASVELEPLAAKDAETLVDRTAGGRRLPRLVMAKILQRAGGVPLYVEEITRAVVEADALGARALEVPDSLQASLLARFDRLGAWRELAQLASVLGQAFNVGLLAPLARAGESAVEAGLRQIAAAGLVHPPPADGSSRDWRFRHALVQESVYSTLLHSVRRELHGRVADLLLARPRDEFWRQEALAWHLTAAARATEAVEAWNAAATEAAVRGAAGEAQHHYEQALGLIRAEPAGNDRDRRELGQLLKLGPIVMMTRGPGTEASVALYERAQRLSAAAGTSSERFAVAFALWYSYEQQGRSTDQAAMLRAMQELALLSTDRRELLQVHHAQWQTCMHRGQYRAAYRAANDGLALYNPADRPLHIRNFGGHDPGVCALAHRAPAEWALGQYRQALQTLDEAFARAKEASDVASLIVPAIAAGAIGYFEREPARVLAALSPVVQECRRAGIGTGLLSLFTGWARQALGQGDSGDAMTRTLASVRRSGMRMRLALYECLVGEVQLLRGDFAAAREHVAAARIACDQYQDHVYLPSVALLDGDVNDACGKEGEAVRCWEAAADISRRQESVAGELAAALRLARWHERRGAAATGITLLEPVVARFAVDESCAMLEEARARIGAHQGFGFAGTRVRLQELAGGSPRHSRPPSRRK